MNGYSITSIPATPPTRFEHQQMEFRESDPWKVGSRTPKPALPNFSMRVLVSSSSRSESLKALVLRQVESPIHTVSWIIVGEHFIGQLHAEGRAASVNIDDASENLFELRRLTGFTWAHLANLLNVDRRTLNNWAGGANIRQRNRLHIAKTLEVLRYADQGSAELNSTALNKRHSRDKLRPLEAIRNGNYETAKQWLSHGLSKPNRWTGTTDSTPLIGEFQPMVIHADADGTEMIEPLPDEPEPVSRKRQIRRG